MISFRTTRNRLSVLTLVVLLSRCVISDFFFFQAEDGIRDHCVTGVQTCALPICFPSDTPDGLRRVRRKTEDISGKRKDALRFPCQQHSPIFGDPVLPLFGGGKEIGRASCRERV